MANLFEDTLANKIFACGYSILCGMESGFVKTALAGTNKDLTLDLLRTNNLLPVSVRLVANQLNIMYSSIIRRDNHDIIKIFDDMKQFNHSFVCILNILMMHIQTMLYNMDRSKLNINSYDAYMNSVKNELMKSYEILKNLPGSDKCEGEDIMECDPNNPMFYIGIP